MKKLLLLFISLSAWVGCSYAGTNTGEVLWANVSNNTGNPASVVGYALLASTQNSCEPLQNISGYYVYLNYAGISASPGTSGVPNGISGSILNGNAESVALYEITGGSDAMNLCNTYNHGSIRYYSLLVLNQTVTLIVTKQNTTQTLINANVQGAAQPNCNMYGSQNDQNSAIVANIIVGAQGAITVTCTKPGP